MVWAVKHWIRMPSKYTGCWNWGMSPNPSYVLCPWAEHLCNAHTISLQNVELAVHLLTPHAYIPIYIWEITARNMGWTNIFRHNFPCPRESKNTARCSGIFDLIFWDCGLHIEKGTCNFGENTQWNKSLPPLKLKKYRIRGQGFPLAKSLKETDWGRRLPGGNSQVFPYLLRWAPHTCAPLKRSSVALTLPYVLCPIPACTN